MREGDGDVGEDGGGVGEDRGDDDDDGGDVANVNILKANIGTLFL